MATPARSPEKLPLIDCGLCSTQLCEHLVCRQCGKCSECDAKAERVAAPVNDSLPRNYVSPIRSVLMPNGVSTLPRHIYAREKYLAKCGVASKDWADASRAVDELLSDCCVCGNRKRRFHAFCQYCFRSLPRPLAFNLSLHLKHGYLKYIREAWELLAASRVLAQTEQK